MAEEEKETVAVKVAEPAVRRPSPLASILAFLALCAFLLAIPFISNWAAKNDDPPSPAENERIQGP